MAKKLQLVTNPPALDVASAPSGLGPDGTALWNSVQAEFRVTDIGGRLLLGQAAAAADMVARLRAQIDSDGLMVATKSGPRAHPALKDELGFRCFITSTLKKLGIVDEPIQQFGGKYKQYGGDR
jgi:hypothetical protein